MLTLNNLSSPRGANKQTKRIGRGQGSGQGTQAGKGHKGQKARKSGHVRTGFEGNNLPLYMRLPKRGFNNSVHAVEVIAITLSTISKTFIENKLVSRDTLVANNLIPKSFSGKIKIIGTVALREGFVFEGMDSFSAGSKSLIEKNGKIK
jgi:large subunit ribosomal protein L15